MVRYWKQIMISAVIVVAVIFTTVFIAQNTVDEYTVSTNRAMLSQAKNTINMKLLEVNNIAVQMSFSKNLSRLRRSPDLFAPDLLETTYEYERTMEDYSFFNQYVVTNFVIFFKSKYAVMPRSVQDIESFLRNFKNPKNDKVFTLEEMREYIYQENNAVGRKLKFLQNGSYIDVFPFIKWVGSKNESAGCIMVLIDAAKMTELLEASVTTKKSLFAITDESGEVILSNIGVEKENLAILKENPKESNFEKMIKGKMVFSSNSDFNSWRYVLISDNSDVNANMNDLFLLIFALSIIFVGILAVMMLLMIRRNQTLLMPIFERVSSEGVKKNNMKTDEFYNKLSKNINKILDDKEHFQHTLEEQIPVVKETLFNNILKGELVNSKEIASNMKGFSFGESGEFFSVAVVRLDSVQCAEEVLANYKNVIKQSLSEFSQNIAVCEVNKTDLAMIFNLENDSSECKTYISGILESLHDLFEEQYKMRLIISVGSIRQGTGEISRSYVEAKNVQSRELMVSSGDLQWYEERVTLDDHYYYPPELETKLINAIKSGSRTNTEEIIKNIFNINLKEKKIFNEELTVFLHDFYGSILKVVSSRNDIPELREKIHRLFTQDYEKFGTLEFQQTFLQYVYRLCDAFSKNAGRAGEQQIQKIKEYIEENYSNFDLSLTMIAGEFDMSSGYLSTLFKENVGEPFTDYLIKIRLKKAKELLTTTNQTVGTIAEEVGYRSFNTFCRAFKRHFGVSAMEMKNSHE